MFSAILSISLKVQFLAPRAKRRGLISLLETIELERCYRVVRREGESKPRSVPTGDIRLTRISLSINAARHASNTHMQLIPKYWWLYDEERPKRNQSQLSAPQLFIGHN